jgi:phosphoribosyl-AMP cyclohydrolase
LCAGVDLAQIAGLIVSESKSFSFAPQGGQEQVEEGHVFAPKFNSDGLIGCIVTDAWTGEVLMFAYMNSEALGRTIESGEAWFFSRTRGRLWKKGEISGHGQRVVEMRVDCDQDTLMIRVEQGGAGACHTGRESCFYRSVPVRETANRMLMLKFIGAKKFDPAKVYGKAGREEPDDK